MKPAVNNNPLKNEEDATLLAFRKTNKIIILIFLLLIISITIILGTLITYLIHNNTSVQPHRPHNYHAVIAFCQVSYNISSCIKTVNYIIKTKSISDPNQIFTLSLQTASKELQSFISSLAKWGSTEPDFKNCSSSLRDAMSQIHDTLAIMWVNPFVEAQSDDQRVEMMNRVNGAGENIESCLDDLDKVDGSVVMIDKLVRVKEYVSSSEDFVMGYAEVIQMFWSDMGADRGLDNEILFSMCMCGLQLLFMFFMFWSLCRMR